jgi:hypothetical protein
MRSLRFKILAVAAALVLLSQAGTVMTVLVAANRDAADRARSALQAGARVFEQTSQSRATQLGSTVNVLASDYAFKQAVASRDLETIESALANHARRAGANLAYLLEEDGTIIASTRKSGVGESQHAALVESARERGIARSMLVREDRAYEMITVPVRAPLPVAWVSMGFALSDGYARRLEEITGLHATIIDRSGARPVALASSLGGALPQALASTAGHAHSLSARTLEVEGAEHLLITRSFIH